MADDVEDKDSLKVATRDQVKRYRAVTTFLSWTGIAAPQRDPNERFKLYLRYYLFTKGSSLAHTLVRDDESISVAFNRGGEKMTILVQNGTEKRDGAESYSLQGLQPDAGEEMVPGSSIGGYLLLHSVLPKQPGKTPAILPFHTHAWVVTELVKQCWETPAFPKGPLREANKKVESYVWVASVAAIRRRIAVGGAPQIPENPIFRRNIFWALTSNRQDQKKHGVVRDHHECYPQGTEHTRFAFVKASDSIYETIRSHTGLSVHNNGLRYVGIGRMAYQQVLSTTMVGLWKTFEQIDRHTTALLHIKRGWVSSGFDLATMTRMANASLETRRHIRALDAAASEASDHMEVFVWMLGKDSAIIFDHLSWLQEVFGFQDTGTLSFDEDFFRHLWHRLPLGNDQNMGWSYFARSIIGFHPATPQQAAWGQPNPADSIPDLSTISETMETLPGMTSTARQDTARQMEGSWLYAAILYLESIARHAAALVDLLPSVNRPRKSSDSRALQARIVNMQTECIEVRGGGAVDSEMQPIVDVLRFNKFLYTPMDSNGVNAIMDLVVEKGIVDNRSSFFTSDDFKGCYDTEGVILSLHLAHKVCRGHGQLPKHHPLTPKEFALQSKASYLFKKLRNLEELLASSKNCCAGCHALVRYTNKLLRAENRGTTKFVTLLPEERWTPCTIPPWTPRSAAQFMLEEAEMELATLVESWRLETKEATSKAKGKGKDTAGGHGKTEEDGKTADCGRSESEGQT